MRLDRGAFLGSWLVRRCSLPPHGVAVERVVPGRQGGARLSQGSTCPEWPSSAYRKTPCRHRRGIHR